MAPTTGDGLGLHRDLAAQGRATSADHASRISIDERYAREWLAGLHGYLDGDQAQVDLSAHRPHPWPSLFGELVDLAIVEPAANCGAQRSS